MTPSVLTLRPIFGHNYDVGYVGFSYRQKSLLSYGIAFFERWDRYGDIPVSHCLVVTGKDECVEAVWGGVKRSSLRSYFEDPHALIFFRKPRHWTPNFAIGMTVSAEKRLGHKYGFSLLIAHGLRGTIAGQILNRLLFNLPMRVMSKLLDNSNAQICSELVATCLQEQRELAGLGCLAKPARMISPQMLFEDLYVFAPWKYNLDAKTASSVVTHSGPSKTDSPEGSL